MTFVRFGGEEKRRNIILLAVISVFYHQNSLRLLSEEEKKYVKKMLHNIKLFICATASKIIFLLTTHLKCHEGPLISHDMGFFYLMLLYVIQTLLEMP